MTAQQRRRAVTYLRERRHVGVTRACRLLGISRASCAYASRRAERVVAALERAAAPRGLPARIVCDHGSEFSGRAFLSWARARGVALDFIRPGKPADNAYAARFTQDPELPVLKQG